MSTPYRGGDRCPDCGKLRYLTRAEAKRIARRVPKDHRGRLSVYRCGDFWHLGHLPKGVIAGAFTRGDLAESRASHAHPTNGDHQ